MLPNPHLDRMSETAHVRELRGAYPADRAGALAGVPVSTVHYWARTGVLEPSLSAERVKLWSYTDLMALRIIYWLRHKKQDDGGSEIRATTMPAVRDALAALQELDLDVWRDGAPSIAVDLAGRVVITGHGLWEEPRGTLLLKESLDLLRPFATEHATGPDLHTPRARLRIIPGKLGGAPHIAQTRVETEAIGALSRRGISQDDIERLYPDIDPVAIAEAIDLEVQLSANARAAA
jgi:uncharacterized protein (DUF433 family)